MIKIVVADDHDIIREGIKSLLRGHNDFEVVGEAKDGEEVIEQVGKLKPDILLLDISMPKKSGLDILSQMPHLSPRTIIIMITVHRTNIYITKALKFGVQGYLHKENVAEYLITALRSVLRGETYIGPKVSEYVVDKVFGRKGVKESSQDCNLTERENDILRLIVDGKTAKQIADILFISRRTVENYKNTLLKKLGLHKTSDLIKYAIQHKIVDVEE